jgi:hypothetical protein
MKITGEGVGGWATAVALVVTAFTSYYTYQAQEQFNKAQLKAMEQSNAAGAEGLRLQVEAAKINREAAIAQREAAAVQALDQYLDKVDVTTQAWASAEAMIDMVGDDPAWRATARRAIKLHPGELRGLECELYSDKFLAFAAETFKLTTQQMCHPKQAKT